MLNYTVRISIDVNDEEALKAHKVVHRALDDLIEDLGNDLGSKSFNNVDACVHDVQYEYDLKTAKIVLESL